MEVDEDSISIGVDNYKQCIVLRYSTQVAVSTAISVRHDVAAAAAAAAVVDVTVRLCAKTSAFYRRIHRK